ncbi:MAG: 30S ribosomal protein S9 [Solirubrobacterales bacterium]
MTDEPKDVDAQDEGDQAAGPVADQDSSSSQAAGEEPSSTPPTADAPEASADDEAPAEESVDPAAEPEVADEAPAEEVAESPAAEQEEAEPEAPAEEPEEPKAEKKKDAIPGADLEPIAVEQDERPLSAEEKARREAEEEEERAREAALTGDSEDEEPATRAPAKVEGDSRFLATGKRKNAIARVTLLSGSGKIEINGRPIEEFFPRPLHQTTARQPLVTTGYESSVDVRVRVHGGGISGQAGAVRHGISRALIEVDPELRGELKKRGFLTRDARAKERRKAGLKKARKRPQFSKR